MVNNMLTSLFLIDLEVFVESCKLYMFVTRKYGRLSRPYPAMDIQLMSRFLYLMEKRKVPFYYL